MKIINSSTEMIRWSLETKTAGRTVGFVPTMGALHAGHGELISRCAHANDETVVSIFVNPTQFNVPEDFEKYPRTLENDENLALAHGATVLFIPQLSDLYKEGFSTYIEPGVAAIPMEGAGRPGHFRGVATIVIKLLNIVSPTVAYFGQKDFQQLAVVRETVEALNVPTLIEGVPTVREHDGLALSSRNVRLSPQEREQASVIYKALDAARSKYQTGERNRTHLESVAKEILGTATLCKPEYVTECKISTLASEDQASDESVMCIAAWFGNVRLIDNIILS